MINLDLSTPRKRVTGTTTRIRVAVLVLMLSIPFGSTGHAFGPFQTAPSAPAPAPAPPAVAPTAAPAETPPTPSPAPTPAPPQNPAVEAKRHFEQGVALYVDKNYQAALAEFQAARQLSASPTLLYNIGLTQKALFNYLEAIQTLEAFLTQGARDPKVTPARRREVHQLVSEMKALLGDARITVTPVAATLTVDGRMIAVPLGVPTVVKLAAGPHTLLAAAPGFVDQPLPITVTAGGVQDVAFALVALPTTARITISGNVANTAIRIDGQAWGSAPMLVELPAGGHQIQASAQGHLTYQGDLVVVAGQDRVFQVALQPLALVALPDEASKDPLYKKWWFWAGIGAAVATGIVIAVATAQTEGPLKGTLSPGVQPTP